MHVQALTGLVSAKLAARSGIGSVCDGGTRCGVTLINRLTRRTIEWSPKPDRFQDSALVALAREGVLSLAYGVVHTIDRVALQSHAG
jgi:hypothetical protein